MRRVAVLLMLLFSVGLGVRAQSNTEGGISGTISDATGAVLPGAPVTAASEGTGQNFSATTDSTGRYLISNLQPGVYDLTVNAKGFSQYRETDVVVEVGLVTTVDVKLTLSSQTESVTVTSEAAPLVDTEQSVFGHNFNSTDLNNLPMNIRRWSYFALLTPGAVPDGTYGDVSFRGVGYIFDNNTIDGASNTEGFFAEEVGRTRMAYSTSLNSVQEFQVTTSNYSAEYGRSVGGVINAVTKSGSNQIHGDLLYYNRDNSVGGAYSPYLTGAVLQSNGLYATEPIKPTDIRQQMAADIGGPIIKDKLFYYFNFDDQIHHFPLVNIPTTPANFFAGITVAAPNPATPCIQTSGTKTLDASYSGSNAPNNLSVGNILYCRGITQAQATAAYNFLVSTTGRSPRTGDQTIYFPKIDWHPNANNTISGSYNRVRWTSPFGVQTSSAAARSIDSNGDDYVHDDRAVGSWTSILDGTKVNELRFIYSRDDEFEFNTPPLKGEPISSLTGYSPQVDIGGCGFTATTGKATSLPCGWTLGAPYYLPRPAYPDEQRYEFSDAFSLVKGNHSIKFGVNFSRTGDYLASYAAGDQYGEYQYSSYLQDFISDYVSATNSLPGFCLTNNTVSGVTTTYNIPCYEYYYQTFGPVAFNVNTLEPAFFVQDDWHATSRLTLNLGLRWDHQTFPSPVVPNSAIPRTTSFPSDNIDFAPRLGFSYDLTGKGTTVIRGGYGMFYGRITNEQMYEELTLTGSANSQINATIYPTTGSSDNAGLPTTGAPVYPNIVATYSPSVGKPNIAYFPGDVRLPGAEEFDAVFEHQFASNTAVSLSYIGSVGRFLPIGIDTNLPAATTIDYTVSGGPKDGATVVYPFFAGSRPNANYQKMVEYCSCVTSHYNAFVAQVNRRYSAGLQFNFSYTYSHGTDDGASSSAAITSNTPVNPQDLALEEGTSYLNVPNRFIGTLIWTPPYFSGSSSLVTKALLSGWEVSLNETAQTGLPYTASISGNEPSGTNAVISSGGPTGGSTSSRAIFVPKNGYVMPATVNTDFMLARNFRLNERLKLQVSAQAFNLFNHQDVSGVTTTGYTLSGTTLTYSSSLGNPTAANNGVFYTARQLQFGAKITF
ncbi:MAG TPA: TonB-dependent receptor [Candidatus Aquilonibacter sp.]|nr:TonB-dependent receptor [Candidatus Aquilonibacter sp.]